jgi:hypothetical protein
MGGEHVNRRRDTPSFCDSVRYMVRNLRSTITIDSVLANCKTQHAFLSPVHAMFCHDCTLAVKPASTPWRLLPKKTWRDSLPIDMLSAVSVLVVELPSSEVPEGLMNYPVYYNIQDTWMISWQIIVLSLSIQQAHSRNILEPWIPKDYYHKTCTESYFWNLIISLPWYDAM